MTSGQLGPKLLPVLFSLFLRHGPGGVFLGRPLRALGKLGEEHVFHHERARLIAHDRPDLARRIEWTSQERGDGAGYDIRSFDPTGAERLIEERDTISEDLKELFSEAKGNGLDVKILKKVLARRKRERSEVEQEDTMIELYENQLGVFS